MIKLYINQQVVYNKWCIFLFILAYFVINYYFTLKIKFNCDIDTY